MIANGAVDMSPGQYGTGSAREIPVGAQSRNVQGTGRVDAKNAIEPLNSLLYGDESPGLATGGDFALDFSVDSRRSATAPDPGLDRLPRHRVGGRWAGQ